jgi:acetyltransferase-like isoleucine patch superfamily enzyme
MQSILRKGFKGLKIIKLMIFGLFDNLISSIIFYLNGVQFSSFNNNGWPKINVALSGKCFIGQGFRSNNKEMSNPIGRFHKCSIVVGQNGTLVIGSNVGMSSAAIVCQERIEIGNNVNIGGNVVIYDTDFHSLNPQDRLVRSVDVASTKTKPVKIGNNVFIGAHSTILKGVSIGDNAIIGACSVVTRDVPSNEIWAGNPIKYIKSI